MTYLATSLKLAKFSVTERTAGVEYSGVPEKCNTSRAYSVRSCYSPSPANSISLFSMVWGYFRVSVSVNVNA